MNGDITTDASPSPSRTAAKDRQPRVDPDVENKAEEAALNAEFVNNVKKSLPKGFAKIKRNKLPTAQATIININNSPGTHFGDTYIYNMNKSDKNSKSGDVKETPAIQSLKSNVNRVSKDDMSFVATHLNESWRDVARTLGYSDGQIQQFVLDHKDLGVKEVIYQMLLDWYQNEPSGATIGRLCTVLWENEQKAVVKLWSEREKSA